MVQKLLTSLVYLCHAFLFTCILSACSDYEQNILFYSVEKKFSIRPPAKLNFQERHNKPVEWEEYITYHYSIEANQALYSVIHFTINAESYAEKSRLKHEVVMEKTREQLLSEINATLIEERPMMLGGEPKGLEVLAQLPKEQVMLARLFWIKNELYQVSVVTSKPNLARQYKQIIGYLDSFKILN